MRAKTAFSALVIGAVMLSSTGCRKLLSMRGDGGGAGPTIFSTLASLVGFEGEIEMAITMPALAGLGGSGSSGSSMTIDMKLKGDKIRMEYTMPGLPSMRGTATIIDGGAKKSYTLMPASKEYMETDLDTAKKGAPPVPPSTKPKPVVTKTGRTEKVAGYSCEVVSVAEPGTRAHTELCVSKGLTFLGMGVGPFSKLGSEAGFGEALEGGFPLRMETFDTTGASIVKMEATRIDKTTEPDSEFQIPPGYKKMSTGSAGKWPSSYP